MSYDGFINLNKDIGGSSQHAVAAIKRLLHIKAGHCGTLDPLASGVLPICLGKATRLSELVMGREKTYIGEICFGASTDSYDAGGVVTATADASALTRDALEAVITRFLGRIEQIPPAISAIKQAGVPLYKRARQGEELNLKPREISIYDIALLEFRPGNKAYAKIKVDCGQGTYIRSLAFDIGAALGFPAHLCGLTRTRTGDFYLEDAYTLAQISALAEQGDYSFIRPMSKTIDFIPKIIAKASEITAISHGNDINCPTEFPANTIVRIEDEDKQLLAIGRTKEMEQGRIVKLDKVFIEPQSCIACAVGNFDGLHLGHRALFEDLHQYKEMNGTLSAVLTFEPHPLTVIKGNAPLLLTGDRLKTSLLVEHFGIDKVVTLVFDRNIMNSTPQEFVDKIIAEKLKAKYVVVGYNFTFAEQGRGTATLLQNLCRDRGIEVKIVDEVDSRYGLISSTNIREHLAKGDLPAVNEMLGYWFVMEGTVFQGNRIGHTIGFPTANFRPEPDQAVPPNGVYAVRIEHQNITYDGVANFGYKPTIGGEILPLVEAHLFDVDIALYKEKIRVWFGKYLRAEERFAGLAELKAQITQDCQSSRRFLTDIAKNSHLPNRIG
jgi:riboflavin kinase/FMN adenylyltransferase/tRNA pseudouridine(55) synthase